VRKEDHVLPSQRRMARDDAYGVYFIFKSMEAGAELSASASPNTPPKDANYRILARQPQPLHALLLLPPRRNLGPDG